MEKLKASELRIGNYVNAEVRIPSLREHKIMAMDICDILNEKAICYGIPLTEEILLKCGFIKIGNNYEREWLLLHTNINTGSVDFLLNEPNTGKYKVTKLTYVHTLQNLYYALVGEELTINL